MVAHFHVLFVVTLVSSASSLKTSFLAGRKLATRSDPVANDERFDTIPFCNFKAQPGHNGSVQVFITPDNTRSFAFENDDGTQSEVKCRGQVPQNCATSRASTPKDAPSCDDVVSCPCQPEVASLQFACHKKMMDQVIPMCQGAPDGTFKALLIGLGGATVPEYMLQNCPSGTQIESIEYDPRVANVATSFFGFQLVSGKNEVEINDGGAAVQQRAQRKQKYDVVMVDAFKSGGDTPESCFGEKFAADVRNILKPGGELVHHMWSHQKHAALAAYQKVFGQDNIRDLDVALGVDWVIVGTNVEDNNVEDNKGADQISQITAEYEGVQ